MESINDIGSYFYLSPPLASTDNRWSGKIVCLACSKGWTFRIPWKVGALLVALKLHKVLECDERGKEN